MIINKNFKFEYLKKFFLIYLFGGKYAYEAEYLNFKKRKEYNNDDKLDFEGEYLNGKKILFLN